MWASAECQCLRVECLNWSRRMRGQFLSIWLLGWELPLGKTLEVQLVVLLPNIDQGSKKIQSRELCDWSVECTAHTTPPSQVPPRARLSNLSQASSPVLSNEHGHDSVTPYPTMDPPAIWYHQTSPPLSPCPRCSYQPLQYLSASCSTVSLQMSERLESCSSKPPERKI